MNRYEKKWRSVLVSLAMLGCTWNGAALRAATFQGLGDLPGGEVNSSTMWWPGLSGSHTLSADGRVVVGTSRSDLLVLGEPFWWSADTGMLGLVGLVVDEPAMPYLAPNARATSGDGAVVLVIHSDLGNRWTFEAEGLTVDRLPLDPVDVSDDGQVIVGSLQVDGITQAALWTEATSIVPLGLLHPEDTESSAWAVSGDGQLLAGKSKRPVEPGDLIPACYSGFVWTQESGMVEMMGLPVEGRFSVEPQDISGDGSRVTGYVSEYSLNYNRKTHEYEVDRDCQPFLWSAETGIIRLGHPTRGDTWTDARAISGDGRLIGGEAWSGGDGMLWHEDLGLVGLTPVLLDLGCADVATWRDLGSVTGISADGTVLCGVGVNPDVHLEAWIADITEFYLIVESVDLSLASSRDRTQAIASVLAKDLAGNPAVGAVVMGHWSGSATGSAQGTTDSAGRAVLTSVKVKNATEFTLTVDDVSKALRVHDSYRDLETTKTVRVE